MRSFRPAGALLALVIVLGPVPSAQVVVAPRDRPTPDPAVFERGRQLLVAECGFCHGSSGRGGSSGPDITRSVIVLDDEDGRQLGDFLRVGRPDRGMPKFEFSQTQLADLSAFLHETVRLTVNRRNYKILDILVGDPKAGESYFNGAGRCATCHSPAQDLKGVGSKYDAIALQQRMLMPRGGRPGPAYLDPNAIKAAVTLPSGEIVTGPLVRLTDFDVTVYDAATGYQRTWLRDGDTPKVVLIDPLRAHLDMLTKWTDADMHNMTAFLASLK